MNNNIYTNNNFIGTTHIDSFKSTSNFILSTSNILEQHIAYSNIVSSNFTLSTSNILETRSSNFTLATSNILETHSSNFTNALRRDVNKWINEEVEHITEPIPIDLTHTYIYNSNILGEIRFATYGTDKYATNNNSNFIVKIKENGRLSIFYQYSILYPTVLGGWYDIMDGIRDGYAFQTSTNTLITGLQGQINNIYNTLEPLVIIVEKHNVDIVTLQSQMTLLNSINYIQQLEYKTYPELLQLIQVAKEGGYFNVFNNPILAGIGIDTLVGVAGGVIGSALYASYISEQAQFLYYSSNSNLTSNEKDFLKSEYDGIVVSSIDAFGSNMRRLNDINGCINSNIQTQQYISDLRCDNLNLNNGNISGIHYVNVNNLITSGKIKQFGSLLDDTYLKPEDLYNLSYNYTTERQYPPKAFNTSTTEKTVSFLGTLDYNQTLILDNTGITYGEGQYEIYSSSTYDNAITTKDKLFNFNTTETVNTPRWGINLYNSGTGDYQGNSTIDGVNYGDFIIIKLPLPMVLSRFRIYKNTAFPQLAPSLWKCFGSIDGDEWFELFQAHNFVRLTESSYNFGYYEKTLASGFTTLYNHIGFSFNSLVGTSGATSLNFAELQLFGKEILSYNIDSYKYTSREEVKLTIRDDMPDVGKRKAFYVSIPITATYYDGITNTTYYKYDLDLRLYTKTQTIAFTSDLMRIFKIRFWYVPSYFGSYIDGEPYVSSYEVYMSYKNNPVLGRPETAGLNIYSVGFPENTKLKNILPNQLMLLQNVNGSINYITIVSRTAPANIYVIIEDMLF